MALAPGHRLGQIIGDMLELALEPPLSRFCAEHDLYLDRKRPRKARPSVNVTWEDALGNKHDLDYVIERGGSETEQGRPAAFIETAWRRYKKHSKAKAQEIEGAVLPVLAKWSHVHPFAGVVLAGEYTANALQQLRSNGFVILQIPYRTIIEVFAAHDVDVFFDEGTPDDHVQAQIDRYVSLSAEERRAVGQTLRDAVPDEIEGFIASLSTAILRRVDSVSILALHGAPTSVETTGAAVTLLTNYEPSSETAPLVRFEVAVFHDNGDRIAEAFPNVAEAVAFLESFD